MAEDSGEKTPLINRKLEDSEEELTGCGATACCDPRRNFHRYFVLGLICFLSFGKFQFQFTSGRCQAIFQKFVLGIFRFSHIGPF